MIKYKSSYPTLNKAVKIHYFIVALLFFMVSPVFLFSQEDEDNSSSIEETSLATPKSKKATTVNRREANRIAAKENLNTYPKKRDTDRFPTQEYETKPETYKAKNESGNFIAIGAEYSYSQGTEHLYSQNISKNNPPFHSAGGVIEIENNFNRYFSLLNSFTVKYMMEDQPYLNFSYIFGSRLYLAPQYFYIDSGIEFIYSHALDDFFDISPGFAFNIAIGTSIPFSETTSLQIKAFSREVIGHFKDKNYKTLSSYGVVTALQFRV